MHEHILIALAGIGLIGIASQWLSWWLKLPAILFLLIGGIIAGPVTGWLDPDTLFGDLLFPFVSLAVAVILFEGSLTLKFEQIRGLQQVVINLVSVGVLVTWAVTAIATYLLLDIGWELALLFGAITVVTGPTVIIPMLRTVRPNSRLTHILRWEGIVIDPIGALLAVLVFNFIITGQGSDALGSTLLGFGTILLVGIAMGAVPGYLLGLLLRHHLLPEYLHNITTLTLVFAVFVISNSLYHESGLLAVTVMGLWLANMKGVHIHDILSFKESLSLLFISGLFIILAARLDLDALIELGWPALFVLLAIQFIARPLKVLVSTFRSSLNWRERTLLGWIGPRGIVAAAVSALFALRLEQEGMSEAALLVPLTFMVIIGTVVLQSATSRLFATWLGVAEPEPRGFLIIGANPVARTIGQALQEQEFNVLLTDTTWENIRAARMDGLPTYYGNPISAHADQCLDLVGIGRMLALSPMADVNVLAGLRFRREFGSGAIYTLQTAQEKDAPDKLTAAEEHRGYLLFGEGVTFSKLSSLLSQGAKIHDTKLSDDFSFEEFSNKYGKRATPLFAIDPRGRIQIFVAEGKLTPQAGWTILSLIEPSEEEKAKAQEENEK
ncbi:sodium:proton antiporter [Thiohalophilus sp.]|uniref:cation:proton antiporter n=1 Tax=Thiohalophilus sp. TaxID=3028392 RepID=UPI002ACDBBDD|nr:sodium:proton antiporter [Thiohalophilus sp.]MDZ7803911.1 sodium:proton antiporter [Thiohalophilus sp.]